MAEKQRNWVADKVCSFQGHIIVTFPVNTLGPNNIIIQASEMICSRCGMDIEDIRAYRPVLTRAKRAPKAEEPIPA